MADQPLLDNEPGDDSVSQSTQDKIDTAVEKYVTPQQLEAVMTSTKKEFNDIMSRFGQEVAQAISTSRQSSDNDDDTPPPTAGSDDYFTDPDAAVKKAIDAAIAERVAPILRTTQQDQFASHFKQIEHDFNSKYGTGKFDELLKDDFMSAVGAMQEDRRASRAHLDMIVSGLVGRLDPDKVVELRNAVKDEEKKAMEQNTPAMITGVGVPHTRKGDKLTIEEQDWLDSLERHGIDFNKERFLAARRKGGELENWLEKKSG